MISRRDFLKVTGLGASAAFFTACAPALDPPTPTGTATATLTPFPTATFPPTATLAPAPTVPYPSRKLCFVLWDHMLARYDYQPRNLINPVPETCPLYSGATNPITPAWEAYWRGILQVCNPDVRDQAFEHAWQSLVASDRAFTNGSGPETGHFAIHTLTCGGATHEMVTGVPENGWMRIYTLNSTKDPPPIPSKPEEIDITRHFFATTGSNVRLYDGSYAVYGFPQFENCIVPLVSPADTDLIDMTRIGMVSDIQRPYHP